MAVTKYIAQALALTSTAYAACSIDSTSTIVNPAGVSALATCTKFTGDVVMETGAASLKNTIDLGSSLTEIDGSLTYENDPEAHTFSAPALQKIGDLKLTNLSQLNTLDLSGLEETGDLTLTGLFVSSLGLGGSYSKAKGVTVINTQANSLGGIGTLSQFDTLAVSDNLFLPKIELAVSSIQKIEIGSGKDDQAVSLPNLQTCDYLIVRNSTSVLVPKLKNVTQNLELLGNYFQSFTAPNLTSSGGVVFNDNLQATNITLPKLLSVKGENGTFQIANNTKLEKIDGFQNLGEVSSDVDLSGSFNQIVFPKLESVGGALVVDTSAKKFDCDSVKNQKGVKGEIKCHFDDPTPTRGGGDGGDGSSDSGDNGSGAGSMNVPLFMAAFTVVSTMVSTILL